MKKFLIICTILFIAGMGCKKMDIGGEGLCACSPMAEPPLILAIKNSSGSDLLDVEIPGAYSKDKVTLFRKSVDGKEILVDFNIKPPLVSTNEKFGFNHLELNIGVLRQVEGTSVYLKLGDKEPYELSWILSKDRYEVDKLLINKQEADRDTNGLGKFIPIFYLTENK